MLEEGFLGFKKAVVKVPVGWRSNSGKVRVFCCHYSSCILKFLHW